MKDKKLGMAFLVLKLVLASVYLVLIARDFSNKWRSIQESQDFADVE